MAQTEAARMKAMRDYVDSPHVKAMQEYLNSLEKVRERFDTKSG